MKKFCIAGPIDQERHYFLPHRLNVREFDTFVDDYFYFVIHAPRQSGKTTAIKEYIDHLNGQGKYTALYLSLEPAHNKQIVAETFYAIFEQFNQEILMQVNIDQEVSSYLSELLKAPPISPNVLLNFLIFWAKKSVKPIVIFFDEVDGLTGEALISFLKQIRTGFPNRPKHFPQSVGLVGVRNLRDYKIKTGPAADQLSWVSPFNIASESIRLPNFTYDQIKQLLEQHTQETGQNFNQDAVEYIFSLTQGQPWLVNALAFQACFRDITDRTQPITKEVIKQAKETLILRRDTHLDALIDRLRDPRVSRIIDAIISGKAESLFNPDDVDYVRDLGLIKQKGFEIANPIYQEIIPRVLSYIAQEMFSLEQAWYINKNSGLLDMDKLLENFTQFFRENSESWLKNFDYKESAPHLLLMAFLQRIINGGGTIHREYALGRNRVDLLAVWKQQRIVIELKIKYGKDTQTKGLQQTADYMDTCNATEGHLIIFDRDPNKTWEQKVAHHIEAFANKSINVWCM